MRSKIKCLADYVAVHEFVFGTSRPFTAPQNLSAIGATTDKGRF